MPFFSVIIPLYNKENYIEATLKSVLAQSFTDFEVIIVNDFSTDNSLTVAQSVKDERIHIVNHPVNKGLSASRNTGIKNATADYIAFLDADDLWMPDFLKHIHALTLKYAENLIFSTRYQEQHSGNIFIDINPSGIELENGKSYLLNFYKTNMGKLSISFSNICIHKNVFQKSGYFDESITYAEDIDFYIRAFQHNLLVYLNICLANYMIYTQEQMSLAGLKNKIIPDFDKYESFTANRPDIKSFLDFYRYVMAKQYKLTDNNYDYQKMVKGIDLKNLNYKQIVLLYSPAFVLRLIKRVKALLIKKGLNPTTY